MFITACIIFILTLIETFSLYSIKIFSLTGSLFSYAQSIAGYGIISLMLSGLVLTSKIGIINHFWNIFSSVGGLSVGYLAFGESLTKKETIGICLSTIGLFIMGDGSIN